MDEKANHHANNLDQETLFRYRLVSEVLAYESMGSVRLAAIEAVADTDHLDERGIPKRVTSRTLYRWVGAYEAKGVAGLRRARPQPRTESIPEDLMAFLVAEKKADPGASIPELIRRAKVEEIKGAKNLRRTTVWRHFRSRGIATKRQKAKHKRIMRRFAFAHRMEMVLCDGKHFRAGPERAKRVVLFYLDDATRMVLGAVVGTTENNRLFLRGLHRCIFKHGLMQCLFTDNGSAFIADDSKRVLANLGIHYIQGTPGYPQARGKVERFNRTAFEDHLRHLDGANHVDPDCAALELRINQYLSEIYNVRGHSALDGMAPQERFRNDLKPLRFPKPQQMADHFHLPFTRRVSQDLIVSVDGTEYGMPAGHARQQVDLSRDLLSGDIFFIDKGRRIKLYPHDPHAHTRRPPKRHAKDVSTEPKVAHTRGYATMSFDRHFQSLVDEEGNFHDDKEYTDDPIS